MVVSDQVAALTATSPKRMPSPGEGDPPGLCRPAPMLAGPSMLSPSSPSSPSSTTASPKTRRPWWRPSRPPKRPATYPPKRYASRDTAAAASEMMVANRCQSCGARSRSPSAPDHGDGTGHPVKLARIERPETGAPRPPPDRWNLRVVGAQDAFGPEAVAFQDALRAVVVGATQ